MGNTQAQPQPLKVVPYDIDPALNPQLRKDLEEYLLDMKLLQEELQKIKKMAAELKHMKNVMYGVMMIMNEFQTYQGQKVKALSDLDNVDSDLRAEVNDGQEGMNGMSGTNNSASEAKKLIEFVKQIQAFIDREAGKGGKGIIDKATLQNLENAIHSIKEAFGKDWGNAAEMAKDVKWWIEQSKNGKYFPALKNIQDAFQELIGSTSALSTSTNTELDFTTKLFQQFLGIDETTMQSYQKSTASMVQNQRSN